MGLETGMNDRMCIVTKQRRQPGELLRFVAAPDGQVVPDLKANLPGRGCWVTATRETVDKAVKRKLFGRALNSTVSADAGLGDQVDALMASSLLGILGLRRKAGQVALGAAKVEAAVRNGKAAFVLHASDAAPDGVRKIAQARHAAGAEAPAFTLFDEAQMSLAFGATNVIHAAVLAGDGSRSCLDRAFALSRYRHGVTTADSGNTGGAAAKETENL